MIEKMYALLCDLFPDEDGLLYKWESEGMDEFNHISKMSSSEVRSFISPSISVIPSQSMIILPIRFGFASKTPTTWRNRESTKQVMDKNKVTISVSNSKSSSGKLMIAGYILLKAPMLTHRLRYLQSLRKLLPEATPHFDILLHRRTPTDQEINHLVVQVGANHVHPVSQALLSVLTGNKSAVYIPRYAFQEMTPDQIKSIFDTHDSYLKTMKFIQLSPVINNIDTVRTETFPDGSTLERTTRDWAKDITSLDGKENARS